MPVWSQPTPAWLSSGLGGGGSWPSRPSQSGPPAGPVSPWPSWPVPQAPPVPSFDEVLGRMQQALSAVGVNFTVPPRNVGQFPSPGVPVAGAPGVGNVRRRSPFVPQFMQPGYQAPAAALPPPAMPQAIPGMVWDPGAQQYVPAPSPPVWPTYGGSV